MCVCFIGLLFCAANVEYVTFCDECTEQYFGQHHDQILSVLRPNPCLYLEVIFYDEDTDLVVYLLQLLYILYR